MLKKDLNIVLFIINSAIDHHTLSKSFLKFESEKESIDNAIDVLKTVKQSIIYMFKDFDVKDVKDIKPASVYSKSIVIKDKDVKKLWVI